MIMFFLVHILFCIIVFVFNVFLVSISNSAHTFPKNSKTLNTVKHTRKSTTCYLSLTQSSIIPFIWKDFSLGCSCCCLELPFTIILTNFLYFHRFYCLYFHRFYCLWFLDSKSSYFLVFILIWWSTSYSSFLKKGCKEGTFFETCLHSFFFFFWGGRCVGSSLLRAGFSLVEASGGYSFAVVCRLLTVVASLVEEHGL